MSIIIIEGCDKTFKTTTSKALLDILSKGGNWEYIKGEHPETLAQVIERGKAKIDRFNKEESTNFILDRFESISDPVYRDLGNEKFDEVCELKKLTKELADTGRRIIVFLHLGESDKILERFVVDKEDNVEHKEERIKEIQMKYMLGGLAFNSIKNLLLVPVKVEGKTTEQIIGEYMTALTGSITNSMISNDEVLERVKE